MEEADQHETLPILARDARITTHAVEDASAALPEVRRGRGGLPTVQAAAAAAGGFMAGAAVYGIVQQRRGRGGGALAKGARKRSLGRRRGRGALPAAGQAAVESLEVLSTRTMLLDVHLLGAPRAHGDG
ncbi:MAG TPA: hypothetical protein VGG08_01825 [Solirubrobacteraceae bacterium]|jgi:hypothetical protein